MSIKSPNEQAPSDHRINRRVLTSLVFWRIVVIGLVLVSPLLIRAWFLSKVPDIPPPFDVAEFCRVDIPQGQNAYDCYREAYRLKTSVDAIRKAENNAELWANLDEVNAEGWSAAGEPLKKWLEDYRTTLALWRSGTQCSDAMYIPRSQLNFSSDIAVSHSLREIAKLAQCDAARLESEGQLDEAGQTWIAVLRCSRHAAHSGVAVEVLNGRAIHFWATEGLNHWAGNRRLSSERLGSVLREVREADRMSIPLSSVFKAEFLAATNTFKLPDWVQIEDSWSIDPGNLNAAKKAAYWVVGEPLVMQRLLRQILANQLNEVDKPLVNRQPFAGSGTVMLFQPDPEVPLKWNQLNPAQIDLAIQRTMLPKAWHQNLKFVVDLWARERAQQITIDLALALQAYRSEHGEFPEDPSAIVPTYFESWPIDPCDKQGNGIQYRRDNPLSAIVWSVGPDGKDDGGEVSVTKSGQSIDVGFHLKIR